MTAKRNALQVELTADEKRSLRMLAASQDTTMSALVLGMLRAYPAPAALPQAFLRQDAAGHYVELWYCPRPAGPAIAIESEWTAPDAPTDGLRVRHILKARPAPRQH